VAGLAGGAAENAATRVVEREGGCCTTCRKCAFITSERFTRERDDYVIDLGAKTAATPAAGAAVGVTVKVFAVGAAADGAGAISPRGRSELRRLLRAAIEDAETRLRAFLCPGVASALEGGGLQPATAHRDRAHRN